MDDKALAGPISPETEIRTHPDGQDWVYYAGQPIVELGRKRALPDEHCHPEPGYTVGRCKMIKRNGERCRNPVRKGWTVCHYHGAGFPSNPGGLNNKQIVSGRHTPHLPSRLVETYLNYANSPEHLSMADELALLDTRMAELLTRLDTSDVKRAWLKVRHARQLLNGVDSDDKRLDDAIGLLDEATGIKGEDAEIWDEICAIVEERRKVADSERKRVTDAQQVMTYEKANMLVAFLMSSVQTHVQDPQVLRAIADDMKRVTL